MTMRRAISSFPGEIRPPDTEDQTLQYHEFRTDDVQNETNFHSVATFCVMTGAKYCSVHSTTSAATNTSTTLDSTLACCIHIF